MMYELKKFIFNKRNVGVFGFLVFFLVCFIGYNVYMDKHYNESQIKIYQKAYRISENRMDEAGSEEESEFWKKVYRNASGLIHFYYNSENKTDEFIESKLSWNHLMLQANNEGYIINDFEKRDVQTLQNETKQLKYLKKNHIEMLNSPYEPNTFNIFNELFNQILYALFFVLGNVTGYSRFFVYIPFLHIDFVNLIIHKQVVLAAIISLMYFLSCSLISLQCFKKRELVR